MFADDLSVDYVNVDRANGRAIRHIAARIEDPIDIAFQPYRQRIRSVSG